MPGKEITDYHTQSLILPAGLFQYMTAVDADARESVKPGEAAPPQMRVIVSVDATSPTQMLVLPVATFTLLSPTMPLRSISSRA